MLWIYFGKRLDRVENLVIASFGSGVFAARIGPGEAYSGTIDFKISRLISGSRPGHKDLGQAHLKKKISGPSCPFNQLGWALSQENYSLNY